MPNPFIDLTPVTSSNIQAIGYNHEFNVLYVQFMNDALYQYGEVPVDVYNRFLNAESQGKFFHKYVSRKYEYERIYDYETAQ